MKQERLNRFWIPAFLAVILFSMAGGSLAAQTRAEAAESEKWDFTELFADSAAFDREVKDLSENAIPALRKDIQKIKDAASLLPVLKESDAIGVRVNTAYSYASQAVDLDATSSLAATQKARALAINQDFGLACNALNNVLNSKNKSFWNSILSAPSLKEWRRSLGKVRDNARYMLSDKDEALLVPALQAGENIQNIFAALNYSELKWETIKDPDGKPVVANYTNYIDAMNNKNRAFRKAYYEAYVEAIASYRNTFSQILGTYTLLAEQSAKQHHYASLLDEQMQSSELSPEIYDALIKGAREYSSVLKRDADIKKKVLGFDQLYPYDSRLPIGKTKVPSYSYADAQKTIKAALALLGPDYAAVLDKAFSGRWIDLYPSSTKLSGAYSGGAVDIHPYVLLNFTGTFESVSTLAHELGHAVHQYRSNRAQKSADNKSVTGIATEVCSITNEMLLSRYMIDHAATDAEKLYYVQHELGSLRNTFFAQANFADFEREYHKLAEKGEALTADELDRLYHKTSDIYSPGLGRVPKSDSYWAIVPHFYYNYYVYSYAVDICIATSVADRIYSGDKTALANYRKYLDAGNSMSTTDLFKLIGIDVTKPDYIKAVADRYTKLLDMEEALLK